MSIFERKDLPLSTAPLYYMALADTVNRYFARLWQRIERTEVDAQAYLNLFRGETAAFQSTIIEHIDLRAKAQSTTQERRRALGDVSSWIGLIRQAANNVARRRLSSALAREGLHRALHIGRDLNRRSAGAVLLEARYLAAILPDWKDTLSPPLHEEEIARGDGLAGALELAVFGRVHATVDQTQISIAKSAAWKVLEDKSKNLLELARLEFPRDPQHPDYKIRVEFEGLDEKFAPRKTSPEAPKPAPAKEGE